MKRQFSTEEARSIGMQLDIDWSQIDLEQFRREYFLLFFIPHFSQDWLLVLNKEIPTNSPIQ